MWDDEKSFIENLNKSREEILSRIVREENLEYIIEKDDTTEKVIKYTKKSISKFYAHFIKYTRHYQIQNGSWLKSINDAVLEIRRSLDKNITGNFYNYFNNIDNYIELWYDGIDDAAKEDDAVKTLKRKKDKSLYTFDESLIIENIIDDKFRINLLKKYAYTAEAKSWLDIYERNHGL